jgi:hypothetical protein
MAWNVVPFIAIGLAFACTTSAIVSAAGKTIVVNGISYYAAPEPVSILRNRRYVELCFYYRRGFDSINGHGRLDQLVYN